jgi:hypothetical protein
MSDRDPEAPQHARLLTALIWAGVGLAPVAALVVLLGGSTGSIRFAVLLIAVCVVLIGAVLLIRDPLLLKTDLEERVEALREELREEMTASAHATSHRVKALQDEMTRMRGAGSPVTKLPPAGPRPAGGPPGAGFPGPGQTTGGRPGMPPGRAEPGHTTGGRGPAPVARPAVATASVAPAPVAGTASLGAVSARAVAAGAASVGAPPVGAASVGAAPVGSASVGSASVGSASVGSAAVGAAAVGPAAAGFGAAGSASVPAAGIPRQRGAAVVPAESDDYQDDYATGTPEPVARAASGYGPGLSGSAWAERSAAAEYGSPAGGSEAAEGGLPAEARPSRRHAAPDTGTDIARFGLAPGAIPAGQPYGAAAGAVPVAQPYGAPAGPANAVPVAQPYGTLAGAVPVAQPYGAPAGSAYGVPTGQAYGAPAEPAYGAPAEPGYGAEYGAQGDDDPSWTGDASWTGPSGYGDGYADPMAPEQPGLGGYDDEDSGFFAPHRINEFASDNGFAQPGPAAEYDDGYVQGATYGQPADYDDAGDEDRGHRSDQYGPDPHGWAPRNQEPPARW